MDYLIFKHSLLIYYCRRDENAGTSRRRLVEVTRTIDPAPAPAPSPPAGAAAGAHSAPGTPGPNHRRLAV
ncbi:hypothetical protein EVAR_22590_1 [Eumeta japonica]|uniref:Uncharacterized protein n=1 Tax=Eumeta variegata TaxID=151549 RepID=A0A4C1U8P6_EUMVA|nr:hypothetical protein EVAR_22590_1 [Eumeta japonica]